MITILTGENSYMLQLEQRRIVADFVVEHTDMALEQIDGEEAEYDRMREALQSLPFLASRKLVVLRRPSANKQFLEQAEALLTDIPDTTDVVVIESKLDKRLSYYKLLKKMPGYTEYPELDSPKLSAWLVASAKQQQATLSSADAQYLVQRVGTNQQSLGNELTKLISYAPHVSKQTIELLTDRTPTSTIFDLLDAALSGQKPKALALYDEQRTMKVEPQQIIALLGWQLHILALVTAAGKRDANEIASASKVNPYSIRKSQTLMRSLNKAQLKKLIHDVTVLDGRLKSEPIDADEALKNLIASL